MKNFMKKCRAITITRKVKETKEENGKIVERMVVRDFPARVNAGVPFDHKMCR